jgi:hypothetical protein
LAYFGSHPKSRAGTDGIENAIYANPSIPRASVRSFPPSTPASLQNSFQLRRCSVSFKSSAQSPFFPMAAIPQKHRSVQSFLRTFVHRATPSQPKTSIPTPGTLSSTANSIATPPYSLRSVHELCRCSQDGRALEEKAAKVVRVATSLRSRPSPASKQPWPSAVHRPPLLPFAGTFGPPSQWCLRQTFTLLAVRRFEVRPVRPVQDQRRQTLSVFPVFGAFWPFFWTPSRSPTFIKAK